jgi:pyrroloquinoline quinone biosynthesis protein B
LIADEPVARSGPLRVRVLGAAAGGGFPQWNAATEGCRRARAGDPAARPATQCSLAVSANGRQWVLLDASPDIGIQIERNPVLHPPAPPRSSPIAAVVLTAAEVDHVAGLLSLREGHPFALCATARVHDRLAANPIFDVLKPGVVRRERIALEQPTSIADGEGRDTGLAVTMFAVPGKAPLYLEEAAPAEAAMGDTVGLEVSNGRQRFFYLPCCAALPADLARRLHGAGLVLFDATLWRDDELAASGSGRRTGRRMGHMSLDGSDGTLAAFAELEVRRKVCIHLNNTNPVLLSDSPERCAVEAAGWSVAHDGMEIDL